MDFGEATNILLNRIQKFEPQLASKVLGAIIMAHNEEDVIRLACAPDVYLQNLVYKTKFQPELFSKSPVSAPVTPPIADVSLNYNGSRPYSSSNAVQARYWDLQQALAPEPQSILSAAYGDSVAEDICLQNQAQFMGFDDQLDPMNGGFPGDIYLSDAALGNLRSRRSPSLSDLPLKTCHYFSKGYCRHGSSCRYVHAPDHSFPPVYSPYELGVDDHLISPGSKEKLELEISELLKSRRGYPVSIASLPGLFHEKYGKPLQAGGYLTESRRQGRAGCSLTKLLNGLKSVCLIERAHGQHDVILTEDAWKYNLDNRNERNDPGQIVSGSRQIYLTFPPESTFTEEDVSDYFGGFGPVEDVRIPCQQRRMFGFVTFASADAVKAALAKGNPHYVCGSRVLVKPYREKSKPVDRKYTEKNDHGMYYPGNNLELEHDFLPMPRCEAPRFRRQLIKDQEQDLEMQRCLSQLQLGRRNIINHHFNGNGNGIGYGMDELHALDVHSKIPNIDQYYMMDAFKNFAISDDRSKNLGTDYTNNESQGIDLPESPFAPSTMGNGISTLI